jgi:hypothetical protein
MGPIIQTIEAGHWDHAGKCVMCKTKYPCLPMQRAKFDQRDYSERLATRQRHDQLRIVGERRKHPR